MRILLEEKLGYEVETYAYDGTRTGTSAFDGASSRRYASVASGESTFDVMLRPEDGSVGRTWAMAQSTKAGARALDILGKTGVVSRQGWFVDASAASSAWSTLTSLSASGAFDATAAPTARLMLASELPSTNLELTTPCAGASSVERFGGVLDCATGAWQSPVAQCCSRLAYRLGDTTRCVGAGAVPNCIALLVANAEDLHGANEARVTLSGLPIEIVYGDVATLISTALAAGTPVLFQSSEPAGLVSFASYMRVSMQDANYCDGFSSYASGSDAFSFQSGNAAAACDFPFETIEIGGYTQNRGRFLDAYTMLESWTFQSSDLRLMNSMLAEDASLDEYDVACAWLKLNRDAWEPYVNPVTMVYSVLIGAICTLGIALVYVYVHRQRAFAPGSYNISQANKVRETLDRLDHQPVFCHDEVLRELKTAVLMVNKRAEIPLKTPKVSFTTNVLRVGDDESFVDITVIRSGNNNDEAHADIEFFSRDAKLLTHFTLPDAPMYDTQYGFATPEARVATISSTKIRVRVLAGERSMTFRLGLTFDPHFAPERKFVMCIVEVADALFPARVFPIEVCVVYIQSMTSFPNGFEGKLHEFSSFKKIARLMKAFLLECLRVPKVKSLIWRFQAVLFIRAALETFVWSITFTYLVNYGFINQRIDWALLCALVFVGIELFRFHTVLHFWSGGFDLSTHFESLLTKKYSSMTACDIDSLGSAESLFRVSATSDVRVVRTDLWFTFQDQTSSLYRVIGSAIFILYTFKEQPEMAQLMGALIVASLLFTAMFCASRATRILRAGFTEEKLEEMVFMGNHHIYRNNRLIRESRMAQHVSDNQYAKTWLFVDGGIFLRWYQDFFQTWFLRSLLCVMVAIAYCLAPVIIPAYGISVGGYVALVTSVLQLGSAIIMMARDFAVMLASAAKIAHLSFLLNYKSSHAKRLESIYLIEPHDAPAHRKHDARIVTYDGARNPHTFVFQIRDASVVFVDVNRKAKYIIERMNMIREGTGEIIDKLPSGGFIGIRKTHGGMSGTLVNVIMGTDVSRHGVAGINPAFRTVVRVSGEFSDIILNESLWVNLTVGLMFSGTSYPQHSKAGMAIRKRIQSLTQEYVWCLCEYVGIRPSIIGREYKHNWATVAMDSLTPVCDEAEYFKIGLVRALLQRPQVLIIDALVDGMHFDAIANLTTILREYIARDSDEILKVDDNEEPDYDDEVPRTVIIHARALALTHAMEPHEPVLVVSSKSEIIVSTGEKQFPEACRTALATWWDAPAPIYHIYNPLGIGILERMQHKNFMATITSHRDRRRRKVKFKKNPERVGNHSRSGSLSNDFAFKASPEKSKSVQKQ